MEQQKTREETEEEETQEAISSGRLRGAGAMEGEEARRRADVVYFLTRNEKTEHPHVVSVRHLLPRDSVRLRDVKRWLSEMRGKDMPESYSWSYKRLYRMGYVWQDVTDEDLINPIDGDEYVLKGSYISTHTPSPHNAGLSGPVPPPQEKTDASTQTHPTLTQRFNEVFSLQHQDADANHEGEIVEEAPDPPSEPRSKLVDKKGGFSRKATGGGGARTLILNLIRCGGSDAIDPVQVCAGRPNAEKQRSSADSGEAARKKAGDHGRRVSSVARPLAQPSCSQCGKAFKPEKFHSHMKSCKALKGRKGPVRQCNNALSAFQATRKNSL